MAKSALIPLGLTAIAVAADAGMHKKIFGLGRPLDLAQWTITLVFSSEELDDVIKIVKSLEDAGFLIKGILAVTLDSSLLGNMLEGKGVIKADEGKIRAEQYF